MYYLLRVIVDKIWCFRFGSSERIVKISIYFVDWSVNTFTYVNLLMKFLIRRQIPGILIEFFLSIWWYIYYHLDIVTMERIRNVILIVKKLNSMKTNGWN